MRGLALAVMGSGGYGAGQAAGYGAERRALHARDYGADRNVNRHAGWRNVAGRADVGGAFYYVVRPGDTRWGISAQLGSSVHRFAAVNGIAEPDVKSAG